MRDEAALIGLLSAPAPERHVIFWIGPLSYYWIWINPDNPEHRHRGYVLNWHTRRQIIHLTDWKWWRPIKLFPRAMLASMRVFAKSL